MKPHNRTKTKFVFITKQAVTTVTKMSKIARKILLHKKNSFIKNTHDSVED